MTVRTNSIQTCDRCQKPFNEKHLKAGQEVPLFKQKGLVVIETTGTNKSDTPDTKVLFAFDDLCPACQKAVGPLIDKLRLNAPKKKRRRRSTKKAEESKTNGASKTPEYTEDEPEAKSESKKSEAEEPKVEAKEDPADADNKSDAEGASKDVSESDGGGASADGSEASSENSDGVIVDPETNERYDAKTGELLPSEDEAGDEAHPF